MEPMPLACNPYAMTGEERFEYAALRQRLSDAITGVRELPTGYALELSEDAQTLVNAAQFVALERLCCPFLSFVLELIPGQPLRLALTGTEGVKPFLLEEFAFLMTWT